jgi:hypothetical protein
LISSRTCSAAVPFWAAGGLAGAGADEEADVAGRAVAVRVALGRGAGELAEAGGDGRVVDVRAPGVSWCAGTVTSVGDAATARPGGLPAGEVAGTAPGAALDEDAPQPPTHRTASISAPGSRNLTRRVPRLMPITPYRG